MSDEGLMPLVETEGRIRVVNSPFRPTSAQI